MPILTYTTSDGPHGGTLNSRVLIGRRLSYGISFSDPTVSRLHAWIDPVADENATWVIADAGSKTGTFVNDQKITRHPLHDGDIISVGKTSLTYFERDTLPDGIASVDLIAPPPIVRDAGILFECACGAPLWVGNELAGKRGMCRHCRQPVTVPKLEPDDIKPPAPSAEARADLSPPPPSAPAPIETTPVVEDEPPTAPAVADEEESLPSGPGVIEEEIHPAEVEAAVEEPIEEAAAPQPPADPPGSVPSTPAPVVVDDTTKRKNKCAVCHSHIVAGEEMITCPDCAMTFHAECWQENLGCSSYGCPQVNCLQPRPAAAPVGGLLGEAETVEPPANNNRWELILLAASVVGSVLGALLFGGLSALVALASLLVLLLKKPNRAGLLLASIVICLVGIAGGLLLSDFYYFDARHVPPVVARYLHL
jgi:hypothetical protein